MFVGVVAGNDSQCRFGFAQVDRLVRHPGWDEDKIPFLIDRWTLAGFHRSGFPPFLLKDKSPFQNLYGNALWENRRAESPPDSWTTLLPLQSPGKYRRNRADSVWWRSFLQGRTVTTFLVKSRLIIHLLLRENYTPGKTEAVKFLYKNRRP